MKLARSMCQLMDRINEHKQVKKDQTQWKGKAKIFPSERRKPQSGGYNHNRAKKEFAN